MVFKKSRVRIDTSSGSSIYQHLQSSSNTGYTNVSPTTALFHGGRQPSDLMTLAHTTLFSLSVRRWMLLRKEFLANNVMLALGGRRW